MEKEEKEGYKQENVAEKEEMERWERKTWRGRCKQGEEREKGEMI